ncbi:DUF6207 family protein [Streptomyces sp. NPDC048568]|uniref:DUF6207 family protein n=1 Tax=Streptomyces sp. NPDC048568 TaxID=3365571 RepID=UPI0037214F79
MPLGNASAFPVRELLAAQRAIAAAERTVHELGEPGVRLQLFSASTPTTTRTTPSATVHQRAPRWRTPAQPRGRPPRCQRGGRP